MEVGNEVCRSVKNDTLCDLITRCFPSVRFKTALATLSSVADHNVVYFNYVDLLGLSSSLQFSRAISPSTAACVHRMPSFLVLAKDCLEPHRFCIQNMPHTHKAW